MIINIQLFCREDAEKLFAFAETHKDEFGKSLYESIREPIIKRLAKERELEEKYSKFPVKTRNLLQKLRHGHIVKLMIAPIGVPAYWYTDRSLKYDPKLEKIDQKLAQELIESNLFHKTTECSGNDWGEEKLVALKEYSFTPEWSFFLHRREMEAKKAKSKNKSEKE